MTLNRWDPLKDLLSFQERMISLADSSLAEGVSRRRTWWKPLFDVLETPEAYVFRADLPGVGRDGINIEIHGNRLTISGERRMDAEAHFAAYHSMEREIGLFERSFTLPGNVDVDRAKAKYEDGVLNLVLPKSLRERKRGITVVCLG
jgi:HSP20 family protein